MVAFLIIDGNSVKQCPICTSNGIDSAIPAAILIVSLGYGGVSSWLIIMHVVMLIVVDVFVVVH